MYQELDMSFPEDRERDYHHALDRQIRQVRITRTITPHMDEPIRCFRSETIMLSLLSILGARLMVLAYSAFRSLLPSALYLEDIEDSPTGEQV